VRKHLLLIAGGLALCGSMVSTLVGTSAPDEVYALAPRSAPAPERYETNRRACALIVSVSAGQLVRFGAGSVVDARGYVLTNQHVIEGADTIYIGINGAREDAPPDSWYQAEVFAKNVELELALLYITRDERGTPLAEPLQLASVEIGDSDAVRLQDPLLIWGYSWGPRRTVDEVKRLTVTVKRGTAEAFGLEEGAPAWITVAEQGGATSSGMATDRDGRMIGIPSSVESRGDGKSVTLVRPVNSARRLLELIPPLASPTPTATSTPMPTDTSTPTAASTPVPTEIPIPTATFTPVPTNTSTPTATFTPVPVASPTSTPTPTSTPLPIGQIVLLKPLPPDNTTAGPTHFEWFYGGTVQPGQGFEVRVWPEGSPPLGAHDAGEANLKGWVISLGEGKYALDIDISQSYGVKGRAGEYLWSVALVQISPEYRDLGIQPEPSRLQFVPPGPDKGEWHPTF